MADQLRRLRPASRLMTIFALLTLLLAFSACGAGSKTQTPVTPPAPASTTNLQVNIGDSPSDQLVAVAVTMNSMILTSSSGSTVNVVSAPTPLEMIGLMGTMQPLAMISIPQGTYSNATMSLGAATVTYMDPASKQPVQKTVPPMSVTVTFNPAVTISGTMPAVMNFDMNMAASVSIDAAGNVTMNPALQMTMGGSSTGSQMPQNGGMQHLAGSIANVSGTSFTMASMMGAQTLTFITNSSTQFEHMSGLSMMSTGLLVMVDATMQSDGTMLAQQVESMTTTNGGMMAEGVVSGITGNPPTQLALIMQNGAGAGMMSSVLGNGVTVNVSSTTPYTIDSDGVDLSGLPFTPKFDSSTISKGQRIEAETGQTSMSGFSGGMGDMGGTGMMVGTINASEIDLEQQGLSGTVGGYTANGSRATFSLTVAPDSAFATLTGKTSISVFQQPGTTLVGMTSVTNGPSMQVRGLLFFDGAAYKLVASTVMKP